MKNGRILSFEAVSLKSKIIVNYTKYARGCGIATTNTATTTAPTPTWQLVVGWDM